MWATSCAAAACSSCPVSQNQHGPLKVLLQLEQNIGRPRKAGVLQQGLELKHGMSVCYMYQLQGAWLDLFVAVVLQVQYKRYG
jgi:hypothetical protein